jgi:hypothetical protein
MCALATIASPALARGQTTPRADLPYVTVTEQTTSGQGLVVNTSFARIDINSKIVIAFDGTAASWAQGATVAPGVYLFRDGEQLSLPPGVLSSEDVFPNTDSTSAARPQLTVTKTDPQHHRIELDFNARERLKKQGVEIKEDDEILIRLDEVQSNGPRSSRTIRLVLVDLGLTAPKEISAPLMVFKIGSGDPQLGVGLSGIWHVNNRHGLQNYLGFGLTLTPNQVDLASLSSSQIGIIPTVAIGLGAKNKDVFMFGVGGRVGGSTHIMYFAAFNLSWITRVIH